MSRSHIVLTALFTAIALSQMPVAGQQRATIVVDAAVVAAPLQAHDVVARMMSFDRNGDGKIEANELPDRMRTILGRGDTGRDGVLDAAEILRLATVPPVAATATGLPRIPSGYTFGDQAGVSTRSHIDGALDDLMLPAQTREQARAVVNTFVDNLESAASAELFGTLQPLLSPEQFAQVRDLVQRQLARGMTSVQLGGVTGRVFLVGGDLAQRVAMFGVAAAHQKEALAAVERFKERLRPGDEDRAALVKQMRGILSAEERDDFRAALERRPLVKANTFVVTGVVGGQVPIQRFRAVERNLLFDSTADAPVVVR